MLTGHTPAQVPVEDNSAQTVQSEVIQFSETQSHSQTQNQDPDNIADSVVLPNPSPRKGVCGSFLNRQPAGSPQRLRPAPSSPHAKQLEEVLTRSAASAEKVQSSPLKVVGVSDGSRGVGSSPLASVRRRLDLHSDKEVERALCMLMLIIIGHSQSISGEGGGPTSAASPFSWCYMHEEV